MLDVHFAVAQPQDRVLAAAIGRDLVGSTGLAEEHGPDLYTRIVAQYYSIVTDAVDCNVGAVYKYDGDGILALFFGSPTQEEDARGALEAARSIASTVSARMTENGLPEIGIRIGISTGPVAVGMLRFGEHVSVSTMGDAVHRAYRLQEMGRELMQEAARSCVVTLVDDSTATLARQDGRQMRFRTTVILRGRSSPTSVYHLLA